MDSLFRFISVRPPQTSTAKTVTIQGRTPFQFYARDRVSPRASPAEKWRLVREAAREWMGFRSPLHSVVSDGAHTVVSDIRELALEDQYAALRLLLASTETDHDLASVDSAITEVFGSPAASLITDESFRRDMIKVWDSIMLIFLLPPLHRNPFAALCEVAQIADIITRTAAEDETLNEPRAVLGALSATILLPQDLLPADTDRLRPVGVADLLVVKQHIERYELGEIVNIENILKGESRRKVNKHGITNERTIVVDKATTTETVTDVTTSERFSLKRESENTVKEDINAKVGASVSSKYGTTQFSASANFEYAKSQSDSQKVSTDYAKDVVSRASTKVTESIRVQQTTRVLETFEEDEIHTFDNADGRENVSGIYQWVNKIYKAQVFNYGKRLLFDIVVPEPASLLLDAANTTTQTGIPQSPKPFTAKPSDLGLRAADLGYYGQWLVEYGVEGVDPPPLNNISVSKTIVWSGGDDKKDGSGLGAQVNIPANYEAISVYSDLTWDYTGSAATAISVFVGSIRFDHKVSPGNTATMAVVPNNQPLANGYHSLRIPISGSIGVVTAASPEGGIADYSVIVELDCAPTASAIEAWRLKTHGKILGAYNQKLRDYQDALVSRTLSPPSTGPLGSNNPDANRTTERTELKRGAIQLLTQQDLLGFDNIDVDAAPSNPAPGALPTKLFPRPKYAQAIKDGAFARFCEQAFEWEQMQYIFYPYYWSRKEEWYEKLMLTNDDALFAEFLKAGQARAVIPVRPSMEPAVWYYLMTGETWMGGDPPLVTDADYLSIAEEIKERDNAPGEETPYGPSWEVSVPTTLIKLRQGGKIEDVRWELTEPWTWTAQGEGDASGSGVPGGDPTT